MYEQDKRAYFLAHPKKASKEKRLMNGKRDKVMEVDMWDQATVAIGRFPELMRLPSR